MKSVLISIQPKWCELITNGKKTIEVRKTKPKLETPFKVYIYCTKSKSYFARKHPSIDKAFGGGMVIGEFICDELLDCRDVNMDDTCLTVAEWLKYTKGHKGIVYGWHISNLVIYDKPRELGEFLVSGNQTFDCPPLVKLKRPPQSWCYVESGDTE